MLLKEGADHTLKTSEDELALDLAPDIEVGPLGADQTNHRQLMNSSTDTPLCHAGSREGRHRPVLMITFRRSLSLATPSFPRRGTEGASEFLSRRVRLSGGDEHDKRA